MSSIDIETATSEELREEAAAWRLVANLLRVMPDKEWLTGFAGAGIFEEPCPFAPEQPAVAEGMAQQFAIPAIQQMAKIQDLRGKYF